MCLDTILNRYHGKDRKSTPPSIPTPPSVCTPTCSQVTPPSVSAMLPSSAHGLPSPNPSHSKAVAMPTSYQSSPRRAALQAKKTARSLKANAPVKKTTETERLAKPTASSSRSAVLSQKRNHIARKVTPKFSLPSLLNKSSRVLKATPKKSGAVLTTTRNSINKLKASKVIEQLKLNSHHAARIANPGQFLTLLPPRTPYQSLLMALSQASKGNRTHSSRDDASPSPPPPSPPEQQSVSPSANKQHTHSVFHDHFALLRNRHIPSEFSSPITSLSLQLPIDIYASCVRARITREEHSYAKAPELSCYRDADDANSQQLNLKLSLPRSLLQNSETMSPCGCDRGALVVCSSCRSLYHSTCSSGTLCTNCITLRSLNLS